MLYIRNMLMHNDFNEKVTYKTHEHKYKNNKYKYKKGKYICEGEGNIQ